MKWKIIDTAFMLFLGVIDTLYQMIAILIYILIKIFRW